MLALTIAALAVGFGNFGASIGIGVSGATMGTRIRVGIIFGIFEAGMPLVGLLAGRVSRRRLAACPAMPAERCSSRSAAGS